MNIKIVALLFAGICIVNQAFAQEKHPLRVDDLFNTEAMGFVYGGAYSFSKNGETLAFCRTRGFKSSQSFNMFLGGNEAGDIFVQQNASQTPVNITNGSEDGTSWWAPEWSPDGTELAMLSTRGGNAAYLWVWNARSKALKQVSKRGLNLRQTLNKRPFEWINSDKLVFAVEPEGVLYEGGNLSAAIANEWAKTKKGKEPAVNILQSGTTDDLKDIPTDDLLMVDIKKEFSTIIIHSPGPNFGWEISPSKKYIIYSYLSSVYHPIKKEEVNDNYFAKGNGCNRAGIVSINGEVYKLDGQVDADILISSIKWAPDESEVAFLSYANKVDRQASLYRLNLGSRMIKKVELPNLEMAIFSNFEWINNNKIIVQAKSSIENKEVPSYRQDWWLISDKTSPKNITSGLVMPPLELFASNDERTMFFGNCDGEIILINPLNGKVKNLTNDFSEKVTQISYPAIAFAKQNGIVNKSENFFKQIIFTTTDKNKTDYYHLDIIGNKISKIVAPDSATDLMVYEPIKGTTIYSKDDRDGLIVWRSAVSDPSVQTLVKANLYKEDILKNDFERIEYTSLNGEKLVGWIMLPINYQKGKKYPVISWVYPGTTYSGFDDRPTNENNLLWGSSLDMRIPAAQGYAVLFPSMPVKRGEDILKGLTNGVIPAIEKVIELGIADPDRQFVMGQSFGGFATSGLITQTKRFKAAVSMAAPVNYISLYSQFNGRQRYTTQYSEVPISFFRAEKGIYGGGQNRPPWDDFLRYIRNSPIYYVDCVETPVMIVQGDWDSVPIEQGEEFFQSLFRQNKRASFVRYWGEYHSIISPANIRDLWSRIFSWFDEFGDIKRDDKGSLIWDGDKVMSRKNLPALKSEDFLKFNAFFDQDFAKLPYDKN